jgi:hypothetical protein
MTHEVEVGGGGVGSAAPTQAGGTSAVVGIRSTGLGHRPYLFGLGSG